VWCVNKEKLLESVFEPLKILTDRNASFGVFMTASFVGNAEVTHFYVAASSHF
jgi:hypothetical protein